jgi:hypothetical protein
VFIKHDVWKQQVPNKWKIRIHARETDVLCCNEWLPAFGYPAATIFLELHSTRS